jgi:uncharacterized protein YbbC (DUF1343 family)
MMFIRILYYLIGLVSISLSVEVGCDVFLSTYDGRYDNARVALLTHRAAIDGLGYTTLERFIDDNRLNIVKVFVPEHGYYTTTPAANIIHDDRYLRIPIVSLYGQHREPTASMLSDVDVIICDLQDVGLRCYTYISTILKTVEAAAKYNVPIVILDRPNPIGMVCDGATLGGDESLKSFISYIDVPLCHGMTIAELTHYYIETNKIDVNYTLVPMNGWKRLESYPRDQLPFSSPSVSIPTIETCFYYPMTNFLSELSFISCSVKNTPFEYIYASDPNENLCLYNVQHQLNGMNLPGVRFQVHKVFHHNGVDIVKALHPVIFDMSVYKPFTIQVAIWSAIKSFRPDLFIVEWNEYPDAVKSRFAKTTGSSVLAYALFDPKCEFKNIVSRYRSELKKFLKKRKTFLIDSYG